MAYMLLIQEQPGWRQSKTREEAVDAMAQMLRFRQGLEARGVCKLGESLTSASKGLRVQVRNGKRSVVDGPFAESKEMIGGIFLLDVRTREEALAIASECPAAQWATVEVRELGPCYE